LPGRALLLRALIAETGPATGRLRVREIDDDEGGAWCGSCAGAAAGNVEIACMPTNSSWLNRIEAQFTALRYFALGGTDHASHKEQASMIRRYVIWRNNHACDRRVRRVVARATLA